MYLGVLLALFFPIILSCRLFYSGKNGKLYFGIYLFKLFPILRGRIKIEEKGIRLIFKRISILIKYKKLFKDRSNKRILSIVDVLNFNTLIEVGTAQDGNLKTAAAILYGPVISEFSYIIKEYNPYARIYNCTAVYESSAVFNYNLEASIIFNITFVIIGVIKNVLRKIRNG